MLDYAIGVDGRPVYPDMFDDTSWKAFKDSYSVGEFLTPCCLTPAIPKTSPNGLRFFAHYSDECTTSPESKWHLETKSVIARSLRNQGYSPVLEMPVSSPIGKAKADVFFQIGDRRLTIEVQHSYQTMDEYLERQKRYASAGIENYWLLYKDRYLTLQMSISKHQLRTVYNNEFPQGRSLGAVADLPVAFVESDSAGTFIRAAGFFKVELSLWLKSVIERRYRFDQDRWKVFE
jgi:competence protein CoiA